VKLVLVGAVLMVGTMARAAPSARELFQEERTVELLRLARRTKLGGDLYWAGRALEARGQRTSALHRYARALLRGSRNLDAIRRLGRAPASHPLAPGVMRRLARLDLSKVPKELRRGLQHRFALFHLRTGDLVSARAVLGAEPLSGRPEARYLLALTALGQGRPAEAREHLERARGKGGREVKELASLALARLLAEAGKLEQAERYYLEVPAGSPRFFRSRQELVWLHLRRGRDARALGLGIALSAPRYARYFHPDRELVQAVAEQGASPARAERSARKALARLKRLAQKAAKFLRRRADPRLYYVEAMAAAAGKGSGLSTELVWVLLADSGFRRAFESVRQLQLERRLLLGTGAAELRKELGAELDDRLVEAQSLAGRTVKGILTRLVAELSDLRLRARELLFDLEGQKTRPLRRKSTPKRIAPGKGRQQSWPFMGELWADEIDHLSVDFSR
jgi:hypothetical protein